ncbi:SRPBCC domain-containing protein [Amycolatopsis thermoflava]|uniref:SRPBCC domain-containing protein n=1 Tax=Amycolatopsis thermoflava TaxID=84480 RepID=UPI000413E404|nr:SRPBCC domain-containing protein [Amycolatopsis thermoflava]
MTDLGELRRQPDGLAALVFERHLKHPPEKVWQALTEPGELATWFPVHVLDFAVHVLRFAAERGAPAAVRAAAVGTVPAGAGCASCSRPPRPRQRHESEVPERSEQRQRSLAVHPPAVRAA